ncbi:uncharacterized protein LOC121385161 isoform X2 [Gigantopelta aegis]|uniref:uncharacterized protein LOC121385161 isoform X2 n=2 Tax=Gigantopelta aegis TaxID=1735272 RepID=UPI001B88E101|nr:uncharacterized protein LOC121385161 isoform X2 [Gigantopelta aegis]
MASETDEDQQNLRIDFWAHLLSVDRDLGTEDVAALIFLCRDILPRNKLKCIKSGRELFKYLEEDEYLRYNKRWILAEMLKLIQKRSLLYKLCVKEQDLDSHLAVNVSPLSPYRKLLLKLADEMTNEDQDILLSYLVDIPKGKKEKIKSSFDIFVLLEERNKISPQNVVLLEQHFKTSYAGRLDLSLIVTDYTRKLGCLPHNLSIDGPAEGTAINYGGLSVFLPHSLSISGLAERTAISYGGLSGSLPHNRFDSPAERAMDIYHRLSDGYISLIRNLKPGTYGTLRVKIIDKSTLKKNTRGEEYLFVIFADVTGEIAGIAVNELAKLVNESMDIGNVYMLYNVRVVPMLKRHCKYTSVGKSADTVQIILDNNTRVETYTGNSTVKFITVKLYGKVLDVSKSRQPYDGCPVHDCTMSTIRLSNGMYFCSNCKLKYLKAIAHHKMFLKVINTTTNIKFAAFCFESVACKLLRVSGDTFNKLEKSVLSERFVNNEYEFTCVHKIKNGDLKYTRLIDANLCSLV